jgi:hypothetical protein
VAGPGLGKLPFVGKGRQSRKNPFRLLDVSTLLVDDRRRGPEDGLGDREMADKVMAVRFLLQDARTQRRYEREDRQSGRGVMVKSAPSPRYVLRTIQRDLLRIRQGRAALARVGAA